MAGLTNKTPDGIFGETNCKSCLNEEVNAVLLNPSKPLIFVRYCDHVLYNRASAFLMQPQVREVVGWSISECDQHMTISWDQDDRCQPADEKEASKITVEAEVQGKASASPGILGSSSVDVDTCHFRTDFDAETLSNEPQPNITMTIPADSQDVRSKTVQCPECNSFKVFRNGFADSNFDVKIQRYVCRSCGRRFSDSDDLKRAKRVADSYFPTLNLKTKGANTESSQVCVLKKDAKNLTLETPEKISVLQGEKQVARGIDLIIKDFQWQLKIEGKVDVTIRNYGYSLLRLSKLGVDLFNPESFKEGMAFNDTLKKMTPIRRHGLTKAYKSFLAHNGIKADIPKIKFKRKTPYIPPKEHQDQLFSHCSHQMAAFCFTMQATGARPIEALRIEWNDIDKPHKRINIKHPAKGGYTRIIPV